MPKQYYTLRSFARGMNSLKDPRDIRDDEASFISNMSIDAQGKIKTAGALHLHSVDPSNAAGTLSNYISTVTAQLDQGTPTNRGGGYNLAYFESDHSRKNEFNDDGTTTFTVGVAVGNISFIDPQNTDIYSPATVAPGGDGTGIGATE